MNKNKIPECKHYKMKMSIRKCNKEERKNMYGIAFALNGCPFRTFCKYYEEGGKK